MLLLALKSMNISNTQIQPSGITETLTENTISEVNNLIAEQGFYLFPALEIPEYGRFAVKITAPFDTESRTFLGIIEEEMSSPNQKFLDLKSALADAEKATGNDSHIIYVEIGQYTIALKIGKVSREG